MARLGNFSVYTQLLSSVQLLSMLWTVALQAPLSMGFSKQESWTGLPCPPAGDLPDLGIEPASLRSPALSTGYVYIAKTPVV